jgi:orotate phosphoribosyltransferase
LTEPNLMERLIEVGAIKEGHFLLASGRHSAQYVEKFDLLRNPIATSELCEGFARRFAKDKVDLVAGPTTGGILLAFEVGRQMKTAAAYAERVGSGSDVREFKRGTTFTPGSRVLVVDDVLTTGGSIRETLAALALQPVEVIGIGVLVDRSGGNVQFGDVPLFALLTLDVQTWTAAECPLCAAGSAVTKPGTTAAKNVR